MKTARKAKQRPRARPSRTSYTPRRTQSRGSARNTPRGQWVLPAIGILMVLGAIVGGGILVAQRGGINFPTPGPTPTPTLSPEVARQQLMHTSSHYTDPQSVEVGCLLGCKQVSLNLTLITEKLLEDMVWAELTSQGIFAPDAFEARLAEIHSQLNMDDYLIFGLTVTPGKSGLLSTGNEITIGPLQRNLALLTTGDQTYAPVQYDIVLDQSLSLKASHKGYVFFPRQDGQGQLFESAPSLAVRLYLNEDLSSNQSTVTWSFDLLSPPPIVTPVATATPGPSPTPGGPTPTPQSLWGENKDVIIAVLELLTAFVDSQNSY